MSGIKTAIYTATMKGKKCLLAWLLLLLCISGLRGQDSAFIDSMLKGVIEARTDSIKVGFLLSISFAYSQKNPPESRRYALKVLNDTSICTLPQLNDAHRYLAYSYLDEYEYDSALIYFQKALVHSKRLNRKDIQISNLDEISNCYQRLGNYSDALNTAFKALSLAEAEEDHKQMASVNNRIGELYRLQNESEKAVVFFRASYSAYEKAGIERGMLSAKANLALAYKITDLEKSLGTYEELLAEFNHLFNSWDSARIYSNLANIHLDLEHYEKTETFLLKATDCHRRVNQPISLAYCHKELAELYIRTDRFLEAVKFAQKALDIGNKFGYLDLQHQSSRQLSVAYDELGDFEKAHFHLKEFVGFNDSILSKEKIALSHELEAKYAAEKKEQQIQIQEEQLARQQAEIKRESILRNALLAGVGLLLLIAILIFRNGHIQRKKNQEIQKFASRIQELQSTQSRWFTNIAHELRTPLTLIMGPVQNILRQQDLPPQLKSEIKLARKYGDDLVNRVNEILEISRLESGKLVLHPHPTNMSTLLKRVAASFQSYASEKGVELTVNAFSHTIFLNIDEKKVTTILNNLLSNALKFTPEGKSVSLWLLVSKSTSTIDIQVIDEGIGISQTEVSMVFDRFYQASGSAQGSYGGSGVGLTLSQELAKLHGGIIQVESREAEGSIFTLSLPQSLLVEPAHVDAEEVSLENVESEVHLIQERPFNGEKPKVLLVDDHPDMRQYIRRLLEPVYEVREAHEGQRALEVLGGFLPDVIISDVKMPGMDGLTFAKKVKSHETYRLIPFIGLTAHANEKDKLSMLKTGVDDYLVKPFDIEELLVRTENLVNNAQVRKAALRESEMAETIESLSHDEQVMNSLEEIVKERLADSAFSVAELANMSAMSTSSLGRHVKRMTGLTPGQLIRDIRLQKAIQLLENGHYRTVSEVVYAVGFEDVSSFSRLFKKRFGKSPSTYLKETA